MTILYVATVMTGLFLALVLLGWIDMKLRTVVYLSAPARHISIAAFNQKMPRGYAVFVADALEAPTNTELRVGNIVLGTTCWGSRTVEIFRDRHIQTGSDELRTLVHELVHVHHPAAKHGEKFEAMVDFGMENLWKEAK